MLKTPMFLFSHEKNPTTQRVVWRSGSSLVAESFAVESSDFQVWSSTDPVGRSSQVS